MFSYDPATGILKWRRRADRSQGWNTRYAEKPAGAVMKVRNNAYRIVSLAGRGVLAHRIIWCLMTGKWPSDQIDHRDGFGLNNRWLNLREANNSQNNRNVGLKASNTSGVKGVHWDIDCGKWVARIRHGDRRIHLGVFTSIDAAATAYQEAAKRHHGDFARF